VTRQEREAARRTRAPEEQRQACAFCGAPIESGRLCERDRKQFAREAAQERRAS
jgi:hypothetical protein